MTDKNLPAEKTTGEVGFELAQRQAKAFAHSDLVPDLYKAKYERNGQMVDNPKAVANCLIAMGVAKNVGIDVFTVVQNVDIIRGKPSWKSSFIAGAIQASGLFKGFNYVLEGEGMDMSCYCYAYSIETGDKLIGPKVTMEMAEKEGWLSKKGSKWKTMPELMIRYRAATFFGRLHASHLWTGMHTVEEMEDIASGQRVADEQATKEVTDLFLSDEEAEVEDVDGELIEDEQTGHNYDFDPNSDIPEDL